MFVMGVKYGIPESNSLRSNRIAIRNAPGKSRFWYALDLHSDEAGTKKPAEVRFSEARE